MFEVVSLRALLNLRFIRFKPCCGIYLFWIAFRAGRQIVCGCFFGLTLLVGVADWASGERYTVYVLYFPIVAMSAWLLGFARRLFIRS